jgi:hypothetical protein
MDANIGADSAMAVSAKENLRLDETPSFYLKPVECLALPDWNRKVDAWDAAA